MAAAFGQLGPHQLEHARRFREEIGCGVDDKSPRVCFPGAQNPQIYRCGFDRRLSAQRIPSVVTVLEGWRAKVNDRIVAAKFVSERRVHGAEEIIGAGPVRGPVDGSAIAQDNGGVIASGGFFELPLDVKNRPLRGSSCRRVSTPREPTPENDAGGFRKNLDVLAKGRAADEFERCRLAGAGAAGEDDTARSMRIRTVARDHGSLAG